MYSEAKIKLTRPDVLRSFLLTEYVTLTRSGAPLCWPVLCEFENGRIVVSTPYVFPTKANNARHNPRVAAFFSDPTAAIAPGDYPYVLLQGCAEVLADDLQANAERFVDSMLRFPKTPAFYRLLMRIPGMMQSYVGYTTRIYIEIAPEREFVWPRGAQPPAGLRATRTAQFTPSSGIRLPEQVATWLPRYAEPPVLAFVGEDGYPATVRVQAQLEPERILVSGGAPSVEGAPASLTYHRIAADMMSNDSFIIRAHFAADGALIPEKVVGWSGSEDDRGAGSKKAGRMMGEWRKQLQAQLAQEGRPVPRVRPAPKR